MARCYLSLVVQGLDVPRFSRRSPYRQKDMRASRERFRMVGLLQRKSENIIVAKLSTIKVNNSGIPYLYAENDVHYATLTVKQTLAFALKTRTPKQLPDGMSKTRYRHIFLNSLLKILGIEDTVNTRVGNEVCTLI